MTFQFIEGSKKDAKKMKVDHTKLKPCHTQYYIILYFYINLKELVVHLKPSQYDALSRLQQKCKIKYFIKI